MAGADRRERTPWIEAGIAIEEEFTRALIENGVSVRRQRDRQGVQYGHGNTQFNSF